MKVLKGVLLGIGISFFVFLFGGIVLLYIGFAGTPKSTNNIRNYTKIFEESGVRSGYMTFPQGIPEGASDVSFYHFYRDSFGAPSVETFLQCTYDEETYQKEIARLERTHKVYGDKKMYLLRDEEQKYPYPAYIAVENATATYEYALLSGDHQITYILTMYGEEEKLNFDSKYLPKDYMNDSGKDFGSGYSIYYANVTQEGIITDYSRDEISNVME